MDFDDFKRSFEACEIYDKKTQNKLFRLAKQLCITDVHMLIYLKPLPDVNFMNEISS